MGRNLAVDVSKEELIFYADKEGEFNSVRNDTVSIKKFLQKQKYDRNETVIGCEATGDYHNQLCVAALEIGYAVKVLNPILTKQVIRTTIRNKKTDYSDAQIIAKLLADGYGETVTNEDFQKERRTMLRTEQALINSASNLKHVLSSLKEKSKTMEVREAIAAIENSISHLEAEAKQLFEKATEKQDRQTEIIDSVPGCGVKLASIISVEAGDIKRFPSSSQFKAYVGIDPKVTQSGQSSYTGGITKRGNPNLRHALFLAANISRIYDPDMKKFYEKKRNEGKSYRHAVCAVERKLCERIYAIVTKDCYYEKSK